MNLREIREKQASLVAQARNLLDQITAKTPESRARDLERQHDAAMAEYEALERLVTSDAGHSSHVSRNQLSVDDRKRAFDHYLRYGNQDMPQELREIARRMRQEARDFVGQGIATTGGGAAGSDGGYLVPTGFMPELVKSLKTWGPMVDGNIVRQIITNSGTALPWPTIDDTSNEGSLIAENTQAALAELTFGTKNLEAYKYTSDVVLVSAELLQDAAIDPEAIVRDAMAERIGRIGNRHLTTGDGNSKPHGVVPAAGAGVTAASPTGITFDEIIDLEHAVDPAYRTDPTCRYMFADDTLKILRKLKDGNDNYIWQPADVRTGAPAQLNGYPYSINQAMDAPAASKKTVLFGAFNRYVHRQVRQFSIRRLTERYADFDQVGFIGFMRMDGELLDAGAVKALTQAA